MWKNNIMDNNPAFQDYLAVEHPEVPSDRRSYLPVYISVFFLIVVLIVVTGVLMNRPDFIQRTSPDIVLVPAPDLVGTCNNYSSTYPLKDDVGVYSAGIVTVGSETYCEIVFIGPLVTVDDKKFELSYPGKLQNVFISYNDNLEIFPANNLHTFPNEFYDLNTFDKLQRFKDVVLGVTIKVVNAEFIATEVSVGGKLLNSAEIEALETSSSEQL